MSNRIRLAVLVSGGGTNLQAIIDACQSGQLDAEISIVLSSRSSAYALERAKAANISREICKPSQYPNEETYSQAILDILKPYKVDLIILAGFMSILSPSFIQAYADRIMNTHPSLLPAFGGKGCYGRHVHEQVLAYGAKVSGATIMFVDEGVDAGPIILQEAVKVAETETVDSLQQKVLKIEHRLYSQAIQLFAEGRLIKEGRRIMILPQAKEV